MSHPIKSTQNIYPISHLALASFILAALTTPSPLSKKLAGKLVVEKMAAQKG
jgi:hypothetical protein